MPCICYGAVSGTEAFDEFLGSHEGIAVMDNLECAANLIKRHKLPSECATPHVEFRMMFVKAFLHKLVGCDEKGLPVITPDT